MPQLTLRELLDAPEFKSFEVISGHEGLDRTVSSVSVMDAPDIYKWMHGGEILITTGYLLRNDLEYFTFLVQQLDEADVAALFVKLGRFIDRVPDEAVAQSDKLGFPIVSMPMDYAFTDVINPVLSRVVSQQAETIAYSERIHKVFIDIALHAQGIDEIVKALAGILGRPVIYHDEQFEGTYQSGGSFPGATLREASDEGFPCYPVEFNHMLYGHIVIPDKDYVADEYATIAIDHASTIIKLETQKRISNQQVERRYKDQFVQDILFQNYRSADEIDKRGAVYGWSFCGAHRIALVDIDGFKSTILHARPSEGDTSFNEIGQRILETSVQFLKTRGLRFVFTMFTDQAALILEDPADRADLEGYYRSAFSDVQELVRGRFPDYTVSIAIGLPKSQITMTHESYAEARQALKLAGLYGSRNQMVFYEDLGVYTVLDKLKDEAALDAFSRRILDPLFDYDRKRKSRLFDTLAVLVRDKWLLKDASNDLFIHYNTMKQRYRRIGEILQMDLADMNNRVNLEIAVKYFQLKR